MGGFSIGRKTGANCCFSRPATRNLQLNGYTQAVTFGLLTAHAFEISLKDDFELAAILRSARAPSCSGCCGASRQASKRTRRGLAAAYGQSSLSASATLFICRKNPTSKLAFVRCLF